MTHWLHIALWLVCSLLGSIRFATAAAAAEPVQQAEQQAVFDTTAAWQALVRQSARQLTRPEDLDNLVTLAGQRDLVLLGEATHGSHEFYLWRDRLSRRLISEQGFNFVAVEGDSAALARLDDYVQGRTESALHAADVLRSFTRWPAWMWRNHEFAEFAEWLRGFNAGRPVGERVGVLGMDVYDPWAAAEALQTLLQRHRPELAIKFAAYLTCFARLGDSAEAQAQAPAGDVAECLDALRQAEAALMADAANWPVAVAFRFEDAQRYLRVVTNAVGYYRSLSAAESWNRRADHMWQVVTAHMAAGPLAGGSLAGGAVGEAEGKAVDIAEGKTRRRGIVWAHNSHIGDAYYTGLGLLGMHNIGQLSRQGLGAERVFSVGLLTSRGQAIAAPAWGDAAGVTPMAPANVDSLEALLAQASDVATPSHATQPDWWLVFNPAARADLALNQTLGHRGIGVVYQPQQDALYYLPTRVPWRYDALLYLQETTPLRPLD